MSYSDAIRLVKRAGGLAVLAHPYQYYSMYLIPKLVDLGLDGIELYHPTQTPERVRSVQEAAARYGLFTSGGSDWHGLYSENAVPVGGMDVRLPESSPLVMAAANLVRA